MTDESDWERCDLGLVAGGVRALGHALGEAVSKHGSGLLSPP